MMNSSAGFLTINFALCLSFSLSLMNNCNTSGLKKFVDFAFIWVFVDDPFCFALSFCLSF